MVSSHCVLDQSQVAFCLIAPIFYIHDRNRLTPATSVGVILHASVFVRVCVYVHKCVCVLTESRVEKRKAESQDLRPLRKRAV